MAEDDSSSDLDVQLEWPQGEEPSIDVGASAGQAVARRRTRKSRAVERVARPEVPPGVKALADRIDGLAHAVSRLDAQIAEQAARLDETRDQSAWDAERILAKLDVLRETTKDLRRMRDRVGELVDRR